MAKMYITVKIRRSHHNICTEDLKKLYYVSKKATPRLPDYEKSDVDT